MNSVPLQDLAAQYHALQPEIDAVVQHVLTSGWYILGQEVTAFEDEFAAYNGVSGCVGVNSGTDALQLALWAYNIGTGDEVITVSHTAVATVAAIRSTGATPVLIDVDPHTYTMSVEALAAARRPSGKGAPRAPFPRPHPRHSASIGCRRDFSRDFPQAVTAPEMFAGRASNCPAPGNINRS